MVKIFLMSFFHSISRIYKSLFLSSCTYLFLPNYYLVIVFSWAFAIIPNLLSISSTCESTLVIKRSFFFLWNHDRFIYSIFLHHFSFQYLSTFVTLTEQLQIFSIYFSTIFLISARIFSLSIVSVCCTQLLFDNCTFLPLCNNSNPIIVNFLHI